MMQLDHDANKDLSKVTLRCRQNVRSLLALRALVSRHFSFLEEVLAKLCTASSGRAEDASILSSCPFPGLLLCAR